MSNQGHGGNGETLQVDALKAALQPGVTAVVRTKAFRCLAVLQHDGSWKEAYGGNQKIEGVIEYQLL